MANRIAWDDRYNIGVDIIDKEHKRLFKILNKLLSFEDGEEKNEWVCQEGIKYFKDHAVKHFADEEEYMRSINYSEYDIHKRIHDDFRNKTIPELEKELVQSHYSTEAVNHFLGVSIGWLVGHTLMEDHAIVGKAVNKWADLLPQEEHDVFRDLIVELVQNTFALESREISASYGGEQFGNGVYYRLVHGNKSGEKCETILVFEDRLLVNTVGKMIGEKTSKLSVLTINATRYTARQFVKHIMRHFPAVDSFELKSENLLTYEQFKKVFEREKPQVSLLFSTDEGYFAYCAIAPHLKQGKIGTSIYTENAMAIINEYLEETGPVNKDKILVVDDSKVVLQSMKALLGEDYDVTPAESGLAAIRCITLNRPDLILLDYEMPVCDGKQVLEMIRAEESWADIPVIFLTGRGDAESVKKVMSLKPAGYLLKVMKPEEIKKAVDGFFEARK
ncbi:MAG: response regulator [Lachnospiraceae bacterium]|nr:response regulator [Lachnospiraceae bacterium]